MTAVHHGGMLSSLLPSLNELDTQNDDPIPTQRKSIIDKEETEVLSSPIHRSIIGGMRRWMATDRRRKKQIVDKPKRAPEATNDTTAQRTAAPSTESNALESIVARSLHPSISRNETREYQAYCSQFEQLKFNISFRTTDADLHVYESTTAKFFKDMSERPMHNDQIPLDPAYAAFLSYLSPETLSAPMGSARVVSAPASTQQRYHHAPHAPINFQDISNIHQHETKVRAYSAWLQLAQVK